ncbi:MAG: hypothetical protein KDC38_04105 [Planctomycetes bacterium]|nr:hypothetical protein [Planctomycetota bacterium]
MSQLANEFTIEPQPDEVSCGASCLHAVYRYFGEPSKIEEVQAEIAQLPLGGTLAVMLARHALGRGYRTTIYTCNLQIFDPSWFVAGGPSIEERLRSQAAIKEDEKLQWATPHYVDYLECGGELRMEEVTLDLLDELLGHRLPVICGLSATWLYRAVRERPEDSEPDDLLGEPTGHFVVLTGIDRETEEVHVADPYRHDPYPGAHHYRIGAQRFIASILLGIVTYDAKLLVIEPPTSDAPEP